jgi:hypothetical protein
MEGEAGENKQGSPIFGRKALSAVVITAVALVVILVILATTTVHGQDATVAPGNCSDRVIRYVNQYVVQPGTAASVISVSEDRGLYGIRIRYQSQQMTLYTTEDCSLLFTGYYDLNAPAGNAAGTSPAPPVKSDRPRVDLYVMAFCPYGTQAETVMKPVVDLLGARTDIRLRFITTVSGGTADTVNSMHGPAEAQEDLRQACIQKNAPEKLWDYVGRFDAVCYPASPSQDAQRACWMNASAAAGIDTTRIGTCASGAEGIALLKADESDANRNGATGSPTLIINGVTYRGARTPEAYKQAICNSFTTAPAECNTTLSSAAVAGSAGGC